jgi:hypothetical protein
MAKVAAIITKRAACMKSAPKFLILLGLAAVLGGCGLLGGGTQPVFDGHRFSAKARALEWRDKQDFTVTVRGVSRSLTGALQAGEHAGIRHCITYFGTSWIDWTVGPDTDPAALVRDGDSLRLAGSCRD